MSLFGQLKKLEIPKNLTREFVLTDITLKAKAPPVALDMLQATEMNEGYFNALLKSRTVQHATRQKQMTVKMMTVSRREDVDLFAAHVVKGWRNVFDDAGNPITFSVEACKDFLNSLLESAPDHFNAVRAFANEISNFRDGVLDGEELAKNS